MKVSRLRPFGRVVRVFSLVSSLAGCGGGGAGDGTNSSPDTNTFNAACSGGLGTATLTWTPPTTNVDGSPVGKLLEFIIYCGSSPSQLS
jgi:hypothetical protein